MKHYARWCVTRRIVDESVNDVRVTALPPMIAILRANPTRRLPTSIGGRIAINVQRIAAFYGAEPLTPEESQNFSLGMVWNNGPWNLTADYYHINVDDRIARSTHKLKVCFDRVAGSTPIFIPSSAACAGEFRLDRISRSDRPGQGC